VGVAVIEVDRFLARSTDREAWLWHREQGITATAIGKAAAGPAGFAEVVAQIENPQPIQVNHFMEWGNEREPYIAEVVKERFGILANDWLISAGGKMSPDRWQMATPDGLCWHDGHKTIAEYKTSGKRLDSIPAHYMRQMQWQMWVTDAERCLFAYELRMKAGAGFAPDVVTGVVTQWVPRNDEMMKELLLVAERLQDINVFNSWQEQREEIRNGSV
jgi:hypothetical protein